VPSTFEGRCLTEHDLWTVLDEGLGRTANGADIERHVDRCAVCRMLLADLVRVWPIIRAGARSARVPGRVGWRRIPGQSARARAFSLRQPWGRAS